MRVSLDQMRAANQECQQKLHSAESTLAALQVIHFYTVPCPNLHHVHWTPTPWGYAVTF